MYSDDGQFRPCDLTVTAVWGLPAAIDGLDLDQMRSRLGCEDDVLMIVLRQFLSDFSAWRDHFELQQREHNIEAMMRMAHTLKGTAANVCANQVQEAALALETALRQGVQQTAGLVQACDDALRRVLGALRQALPPETQAQPDQMLPAQALAVVQDVAALLQRRRHVSSLLQQELRAAVALVASDEELSALSRHLSAFDFKKAQQLLADIQSRMLAG